MVRQLVIAALCCALPTTVLRQTVQARPLIEQLRLDGGQHLFNYIAVVRVGPDSSVIVAERDLVHIFSLSGSKTRTLGRTGRGPGEFLFVNGVGVVGDSIWVSDAQLNRITVFDRTGAVARTTEIDSAFLMRPGVFGPGRTLITPPVPPAYTWAPPIRINADGSMLMLGRRVFSCNQPTSATDTIAIWKTTRTATITDTLLHLNYRTGLLCPREGYSGRGHPFADGQVSAISVNGRRFAQIAHSYTGPTAWSFQVRVFDDQARTVYTRRYPFARHPIPKVLVDSVVRDWSMARGGGDAEPFIRRMLNVQPSYPPVTMALVDDNGVVWLRGPPIGAGSTWTVLDPTGQPVATFQEPARTRFLALDRGAWAVTANSDDVQSIVRYGIRP